MARGKVALARVAHESRELAAAREEAQRAADEFSAACRSPFTSEADLRKAAERARGSMGQFCMVLDLLRRAVYRIPNR